MFVLFIVGSPFFFFQTNFVSNLDKMYFFDTTFQRVELLPPWEASVIAGDSWGCFIFSCFIFDVFLEEIFV